LIQDLSQEQLDYVPAPGEWSIGEVVDYLILSEQVLRQDVTILIERAEAGQTPYLYRSFAEFNARSAFLPECALSFLIGSSSSRLTSTRSRQAMTRCGLRSPHPSQG
jgi:hypothetical protein